MSDMHSSLSAASVGSTAIQHYSVEPFSHLPPTVADAIFQRLTRLNLAECSLVCKAWRHLPLAYLHSMSLSSYTVAPPAALLSLCWHLREIHVSSSETYQWAPLARVLSSQQLPSLRLLAIQHSSHTNKEQLLQLQQILLVQGPQCSLHLALTDNASLRALLPFLPLPGLVQLDFNVPYLPEGAAALLAQAAAMQAAGSSNTAQQQKRPHTHANSAAGRSSDADLQQHMQQQQQQMSFSVGVWVCCWGGCRGISLPDVLQIKLQLQAVGCSMHGIESINCSSNDDVVAMGQAVQDLQGLTALGFNYKPLRGTSSATFRAADTADAVPPASALTTSSSNTASSCSTVDGKAVAFEYGHNTAALTALLPLAGSLQKLTMHGWPDGGFGQGPEIASASSLALATAGTTAGNHHRSSVAAPMGPAGALPAAKAMGTSRASPDSHSLHPLASLTNLTKLSLLKQWHGLPMPIEPIAHLTGLVELALERQQLAHRAELSCLSRLARLRVLSLVLTVTAEDLKFPRQQLPVLAASQGYTDGVLCQESQREAPQQLERSVQKMQLWQQVPRTNKHRCNCCCGSVFGVSRTPGTVGTQWSQAPAHAAPASQPQTITNMLQGVLACPCSHVTTPILLDWEWMRQLNCLETAWLQVPHLDLACLPSSLTELDAQQSHDLTAVNITCSSRSACSIYLPNLRRAVLPRTASVTLMPASPMYSLRCGRAADPNAALAQGALRHAAEQTASAQDACNDCEDDGGSTDNVDDNEQEQLQLHYNTLLLLKLCAACPALRELELVQWELPAPVVLNASKQLRHIRLFSMLQPESTADAEVVQQHLSNAAGSTVVAKLQERLVLATLGAACWP